MKVLVLSTVYPNPNRSTAGIFVHEQVKQLIKLGVDVRVVCPIALTPPAKLINAQRGILSNWKNWILSKLKIPKETIWDGVSVYYPKWVLFPKIFFPKLEAVALFCSLKGLLRRIWQDWKWDVIHANFLIPNGITAEKIAKKYNAPLVISCLGADLNYYGQWKSLRSQVKSTLQNSDAIICKSKQLKVVAIELGANSERVFDIYNGCNLADFKPLRKINKQHEILFIGGFIERKGLPYLIEAFSALRDKQIKLRLIGDGEKLPQLRRMVYHYDLQDRVIFQGTVPHAEIVDYLNSATLLCLPSISEGTPNVVMEALACGTPVVASRVGGIPDIVPSYCGVLVLPKNAVALQNSLEEALEKDWDYQAIRNFAEQNLSSEVQCKKIIKIYQQISCGKRLFPRGRV